MTKLARLPDFEGTVDRETAEPRVPRLRNRYYAFLSYSHKDKELANWLHGELEKFRVPAALAGKLTANGVVPRRLTPIFRDQHDLSAGDDLAVEIEAALAASQFLIVLCSPIAANSRWMNLEIESFKRTRPEGCVLAAIASGEPFASDMPGREDEECFPLALRYKYDRRQHRTEKRAEPLAADFREEGEGRRLAFLKLVAGMLGVGLDELVQRDQTRRQRRLAVLAAASLAGMAVTSTLAVAAIQARDSAREQRRQAEGLIGFMLGDLKDRLEPIGRLDALDGVGARVLAYYQREGTADLSDASLSQRSGALSLMAEVATKRGDVDGALRLYTAAIAGTAEAIRRNPQDPQRLFDHAQNVFYVGQIAHERSDFKKAEAYMRDYKRLARGMVALGPDNMKWRMEQQYADVNLAVALFEQRRFAEAVAQYQEALSTIEAISTADPSNQDYRTSVGETLAWLADAQEAVGDLNNAAGTRRRDVALLDGLFERTGDVNYRQRLVPAHRALGDLYAERGQSAEAIEQFRSAVAHADALREVEPSNAQWLDYGYRARLDLAKQLLVVGQQAEAAAQLGAACEVVRGLLKSDPSEPKFRQGLTSCLMIRSEATLKAGQKAEALDLARQSLATARTVRTGDPVANAYLIAKAFLLLGDVEHELGDAGAARSAWAASLATIPREVTEKPDEAAIHAKALVRLDRMAEALPLQSRLRAMGYRSD
jgi:tetratricopeptide (TPR) repeat protein